VTGESVVNKAVVGAQVTVCVARLITIENEDVVVVAVFESVTLTVIAWVPAVVGVPVIAPLKLKLNPFGSVPDATAKTLFPEPPVLEMFKVVKEVPTVPLKPVVGVVMLKALDIVSVAILEVEVAVVEFFVLVTTTR
jgi:hypothetical protein